MADFAGEIRRVESSADYIHCDVMDGHFVPNLTFGAPVVAAVRKRSKLPLDVHLMIESPGKWIDDYLKAGLDRRDFLTIHLEAESDAEAVLREIAASGVRPGIAVKPGTDIRAAEYLFPIVEQVLIMTVEPGFGGQKFMLEMVPKIRYLHRTAGSDLLIGVDGGIDAEAAPIAAAAGARLLVAGGAVYGDVDPARAVEAIRRAAESGL